MSYHDEHDVQEELSPQGQRRLEIRGLWDNTVNGVRGEPPTEADAGHMLDMLLDSLSERFGIARNGHGMDQSFIDGLERIDKKYLKTDEQCPICSTDFLEDKYPLVVELPCAGHHRFDLECITPWLKDNSTCPLCRHDMAKATEKQPIPVDLDDEEEYDDMYA